VTLFNASEAVSAVAGKRPQAKPANPPQGSSNRASSDRLSRLESKVSALAGRVDGHDSRFSDQETWNAQAQKRVDQLETITGGANQRQCPGCQEMRPDGPEAFPGYLERAATVDEPERHEWRQLCVMCRQGRVSPDA
jgi:hypothetical protein